MNTSTTLMTAEDLLERSSELGCCELVRGELKKMAPAGGDHGEFSDNLSYLIGHYARQHRLGKVYSSQTGFLLSRDPDTVREADVSFIRSARRPKRPTPGYIVGAPDLVVEVLSPNDRAAEVAEKIDEWFAGGAEQVWIVNPRQRTVTVHHDARTATTLREDQTLEGGKLLPGWSIRVGEVFG